MTNIINAVVGADVLVQIGESVGNAVVYSHANVINTTRAITFTLNAEADELVDLDDQNAPANTTRRARSFDCKIDGAGKIHKDDVAEWLDWSMQGGAKPIRFVVGGRRIVGPFLMTSFAITGERTQLVECSITLEQAGALTHEAVA